MSTNCIVCGKTATRLVQIVIEEGETSPVEVQTCAEHARYYVASESYDHVLVRLLTVTTTAMTAPIRSRHVKIVLADNGITIGEHDMVTKVTAEHTGPTHVHCNPGAVDRVEEVLRFQNWTVASSTLANEWVVLHDSPTFVDNDSPTPGLARAIRTVRLDELARVEKFVDDLRYGENSVEVLNVLGMVLHAIDARRIELDTDGDVY